MYSSQQVLSTGTLYLPPDVTQTNCHRNAREHELCFAPPLLSGPVLLGFQLIAIDFLDLPAASIEQGVSIRHRTGIVDILDVLTVLKLAFSQTLTFFLGHLKVSSDAIVEQILESIDRAES